ncbi:MAG: leucine-rich repeat protein [Clostridia bacterium]|nr:leucine-rich repeat protein [Clostridia bacterium]
MKKMLCILFSILTISTPLIPAFTFVAVAEESESARSFVTDIQNIMYESETDGMQYRENFLTYDENNYSEFKSCKLIVKSKKNIDTLGAAGVVSGYNDLWILKYNSAEETASAYEYYSSCNGIDYVEVDKALHALSAEETNSTSEKKYSSWGPSYIGLDEFNKSVIANNIYLPEKIVAVLDTGAELSHPALEGRIIPSDVNTSTSGDRNSCSDDNGHGTQVAGIIIDSTLDNIKVKPYKVLDLHGNGTLITLAAGIISAVNDKVDVINMSIAYSESSEVLKEAIMLAERNNIIMTAASGNDSSTTLYYPASYDGVMKIGAINEAGVIANFSTRSSDVDFAAPGVNVYTATIGGKYKTVSGTSFSAPLAAALAATLISFDPKMSPEDVYRMMCENAVSVQETDSVIKYGHGIIRTPAFWDPSNPLSKTETPYFSHPSTIVYEEIDLQIFCDTPGSVIYYTTDRSVPSVTNPSAVIYDGTPIHISQTTVITAVAYCEGKYRSSVTSFASIVVPVLSEEYFEIDSAGNITSYSGTQTSFTVPETINGITVTGVGESAFKGTKISEIILPDTVTTISKSAFEECTQLKTIRAENVSLVGERAFYNCIWLKNIYLYNLVTIGKYAFYNVCSLHYELTGTTFSLNLDKTTTIMEGAFNASAISDIKLLNTRQIAKYAFLDCPALVSIHIQKLSNIANEAFKNCTSLTHVEINGLSSLAVGTFSGCTALNEVNIPDASVIYTRVFEKCTSLEEITLESAQLVYSAAFTGCNSLRIIVLPSMTEFESAVYEENTTTFPKFSDALQAFIAPSLTRTSAYMFGTAPNILSVSLKSLSDVADYTFSGCKNMMYLNIQSVTELSALSLAGCEIDFIDARNLITAEDFPDNSGIMLSNKFESASSEAINLTVYGTKGNKAEEFANTNHYTFYPIPYVYGEIPEYITQTSGSVTVRAAGFDLKYQWYSNTIDSNTNGTPIENATSETYTFTQNDKAYYYYCVITQNDFGTVTEYRTDTIIKDPKSADFSLYNIAVRDACNLNPLNYTNYEIVEEALAVDVSQRRSCEQRIVDLQTSAIRSAMARLNPIKVTSASLSASKKSLKILEVQPIKVYTNPSDSMYKKIEWSSDNTKAFIVSKSGRVRCVGHGTAFIKAKIINYDGTFVIASLKFKSKPSTWPEELFATFFRVIFLMVQEYENNQ